LKLLLLGHSWRDSFIPSMKYQNRIFWMVHRWVLGHSSQIRCLWVN
jgi:hypothetical protein